MKWLAPASLAIGCLVGACGSEGDASDRDAGDAASDASLADAAADAPALVPAAPAPPVLTPCAPGWRTVPPSDADDVVSCDPRPAVAIDCADGEAIFVGEPGCAPIGDPCPDGLFPAVLPAGAPVLHVLPGASGGDGSAAAPFGTIGEALDVAPAGAVVAIGKGTYSEYVRPDRDVTLVGACSRDTLLVGDIIANEPPIRLDIRGMRIDASYAALIAYSGTTSLRGVVFDGPPSGAAISIVGGEATLERVVVRAAGSSLVAMGARVVAVNVILETRELGAIQTSGSTVEVRDSALLGVDGTGDVLVQVFGEGSLVLDRVLVESVVTPSMIFVDGSHLTARDTVVIGPSDIAYMGSGLLALERAQVDLSRIRFVNLGSTALFVGGSGTRLAATDVVLRDAPGDERGDGRAIEVDEGATVVASRATIDRARAIAVLVTGAGAQADLVDVAIRDTRSDPVGTWGRAIHAQLGGAVRAERIAIREAREAAVVSFAGGSVDLVEASIDRTLARDCVTTTCGERGAGAGLVALAGGAIVATRFAVWRSALVGVQIAEGGAIDLHEGVIGESPIGINVQDPTFDLARLDDRVAFVRVGSRLDATTLPIPDTVATP